MLGADGLLLTVRADRGLEPHAKSEWSRLPATRTLLPAEGVTAD
jgi:hypothetical protein